MLGPICGPLLGIDDEGKDAVSGSGGTEVPLA